MTPSFSILVKFNVVNVKWYVMQMKDRDSTSLDKDFAGSERKDQVLMLILLSSK